MNIYARRRTDNSEKIWIFLNRSKTQKNKATEYHLGTLKAKLAKYRAQLLEPTGEMMDCWSSGQSISPRC